MSVNCRTPGAHGGSELPFSSKFAVPNHLAPNETVQWLWQCERDAFLIGIIKVKLKTVSKYDVLISDKASLHIHIVYLCSHN